MREILFRGKREDNGEWVEGASIIVFAQDKVYIPKKSSRLDVIHDTHSNLTRIENTKMYKVDVSTIGQYTGLTDKNGTKIFEGDICEFTNADGEKTPYKVLWDFHRWLVQMGCENIYPDDLDEDFAGWAEVIGNIHDNPELLEV